MPDLWWVALGGAIGAALRHHIDQALRHRSDVERPWGILAANLIACFVLGTLLGASQRGGLPEWLLLAAATGFCGALSTWSTLAGDTRALIRSGQWSVALGSLVAHLAGGIGLAWLGVTLAG